METYNSAPYYDDFDGTKNFHQIMFKPGFAVQARELTQLQTILRDQIEKFGSHIFKHGSVVIPGNSLSDLAVPYAKIEAQYNSVNIDLNAFLNQVIVGATSGVEAIVKKTVSSTETDPVVFYLSYVSGNVTTGDIVFQNGEEIYLRDAVGTRANIASSAAVGIGSLAYINSGVYYVNGTFVSVAEQSTVLSKFGTLPSCHVLLQISETLVDSIDDDTLLDNAQGSYNYSAPGADRIKIALTLTTLPLGSDITKDYVEIMRFNEGVLEEHSNYSKYSELAKSLARRTFDESGNYVVTGLDPTIREHLKVGNNGGVFVEGDTAKLVVDVSKGRAYVEGFEVEKIANTKIVIDKARTAAHIESTDVSLRPTFGQHLIVSNLVGGSAGFTKGLINLYNASNPADGTATLIGTAKVIGLDYLDAGELQPNMYKLIVSDLVLTGTYGFEDIGGIRYTNGRSAYVLNEYLIPVTSGSFTAGETIAHTSGRTATVRYYNPITRLVYAYKHSSTAAIPRIGDQVVGSSSSTSATVNGRRTIISVGNSGFIFRLPKNSPATLRDRTTNAYNLRYTVQKQLTMTVVAGTGSASISSGTFDAIEEGTFVAIGATGPIDNSFFSISGNSVIVTSSPQNGTVIIYANITKEDVFPKTKSLQTYTETITSPGSVITLSKADVVSLTSVVDSLGNITPNYTMINGQTDYEYGFGQLRLNSGRPSPAGNITVTYTYYQHSGTGDFFCVDSYTSVPNFLESPQIYNSLNSNKSYDLSTCVDFRPMAGAASSDIIVEGTVFNTTLQYYVPRIDSLVVDPAGKLLIISGTPKESPQPPTIPSGQFEINRFLIPEYTRKAISVVNKRMDVERFTMNDIKKISNRVDRVEEYATLTATELLVTKFNVRDAETGLDRYKTGYLVENFKQPFTFANTINRDYAATFVNDSMQAPMEPLACKLKLMETSTNYVIKNGFIMLPYTEEVFANQPLSSRVTNLNPFLMISWNGVLDVQPPVDTWVEMIDLPTVYNQTTEEIVVNVFVDPPLPPTYNIRSNFNVVDEGSTVTFTVNTQRVANGTTLYWTIAGDVVTNDFTDSALSGSVVINNNVGTFNKTISNDAITEGSERFRVQLRTGSTSGPIIADCVEVIINDTSGNPPIYIAQPPIVINEPQSPVIQGGAVSTTTPVSTSYNLSSNLVTANEGSQIAFTVVAINVPDDTTLYWTSDGTSTAADFDDNVITGTTVVTGSLATIVRPVKADAITEGEQTVRVKVYTDAARTNLVATSNFVTIVDSSKLPTYTIVPSNTLTSEGQPISFSLYTTDVLNGTTLYWSIVSVSGTVNAADFTDGLLTGSVIINNSTASFDKTISADFVTDASESFEVRVYSNSGRTTLVATSPTVAIVDSSQSPTYVVTPLASFVEEGGTATFSVTTTNVTNGTTVYWGTQQISGTMIAADFTDALLVGSAVINNGTATISRTLSQDILTEGSESFQIVLYSNAARTTQVGISSTVLVVDTSQSPSYGIAPAASFVEEGTSLTFNISTTNVSNGTVLYWGTQQISGTVAAGDFTDNTLTGTLTVTNNIASLSRSIVSDFTTEGVETFQIKLYTDAGRTILAATSSTVTIVDTSTTPSYAITPAVSSVAEGNTALFNITTNSVPNGTVLYWNTLQTTGTIASTDFTDGLLIGSVTINNSIATLSRAISADASTEGNESFQIRLYSDAGRTQLVATSSAVLISDTSLTAPTYQVVPTSNSVNEGSASTFNVTTTDVANGTVLYWGTEQISGNITSADFSDSVLTGNVTISSNIGSISRTLVSDLATEGNEAYRINLYTDAARTVLVATSSTVTISDTSRAPTYLVTPSVSSVNEGSAVAFNLVTTNVANSTVLYWNTEIVTGDIAAADFNDSVLVGSVTISSNTGSISRTLVNDILTEGNESFRIRLYSDAARTLLVAASSTVTISDTSKAPTYTIVPTVSSVNEGGSVIFNVATANVSNGTVLYWNTQVAGGSVASSDFADATLTGSVTINSNTGSISRTLVSDVTTEGAETFNIRLYSDSGRTQLIATSSSVLINDTSLTATYSLTPNVTSVNEGSSATFNLTTSGVTNGTVLYWNTESVRGTIAAADFTDSTTSGSVTVTSNAAAIVRGLTSDTSTEGFEEFRIRLYTDSGRTQLVAVSSVVGVNDISLTYIEPVIITPPADVITYKSYATNVVTYGGIYGSVLGRDGDEAGVNYWVDAIAREGIDKVISDFLLNPEAQQYSSSPISLSQIDKSALTTRTVSGFYVTETYVNGILSNTTTQPTHVLTTGTGLNGELIYDKQRLF